MQTDWPASVPTVSVVVPVWNGEATIAACVESLVQLDYPAQRREILVVDNRSTDRTAEVVRSHGVRLLHEDAAQSSYAARNTGARAGCGDILAFTDADCIVERGWLRALVGALAAEDVGGVAGYIQASRRDSPVLQYQAERSIRADRAFRHPARPFAQTANAAYRRSAFARLNGFDASIVYGGDLDLSWRMQRDLGLRLVYEPCALVWHQHRSTARGLFKLYEKNAIANCLLAQRYEYFDAYPELRTLLFLTREMSRSALLAGVNVLAGTYDRVDVHSCDAIRWAGEAWGWLRWRSGRAAVPTIAGRPVSSWTDGVVLRAEAAPPLPGTTGQPLAQTSGTPGGSP